MLKVLKVWKEHEYARGANSGLRAEAVPLWSAERERFGLYPPTSNLLSGATGAATLGELWDKLDSGLSVGCTVPVNGDTHIINRPSQAIVER